MKAKKQAQVIAELRAKCERDSAALKARIEAEFAHARANSKRYPWVRPAKYPWRNCAQGMGNVIETGIGPARVLAGTSGAWQDWTTDHPSRVITLKTTRHVWTFGFIGSQLTKDTTWLGCQDIVEIGPERAIFVNGAKSGPCEFRALTLAEMQEQALKDQLNPPPSTKGNRHGRTPATKAEIKADAEIAEKWRAYGKQEADVNGNRKPSLEAFAVQIGKTAKQVREALDRARSREKARARVKVPIAQKTPPDPLKTAHKNYAAGFRPRRD